MRNIKLILEYDGTNYHGWQSQRKAHEPEGGKPYLTIQETIEKAIASLTGGKSNLIAAGRTDAGVHAIGQVACFKSTSSLDADTIKKALNAKLPHDIRVIDASDADESFHPRHDAAAKTYIYLISSRHSLPVFIRRFIWAVPYKLNLRDMADAAEYLKGRHDFSAFRASGCSAKTLLKEVRCLAIDEMDSMNFLTAAFKGNFVKITIEADAFLRHMARNIVGTLVDVGRGMMSPKTVPQIIASRDRRLAGPTAPPMGLFLEKVSYNTFFSMDSSSSLFS